MIKKINKIIMIYVIIGACISLIITKSALFAFSVIFGGIIMIIDFFLLRKNTENLLDKGLRNRKIAFIFANFSFIFRIFIVLLLIVLAWKLLKISFLGLLIGLSGLPVALFIHSLTGKTGRNTSKKR